jgi:N6-L-threonylcarbamoyladenine synthase
MQLITRSTLEMKARGVKRVCVCGGVSANGYLREKMRAAVSEFGGEAVFPKFEYCTDNAAMVCAAAALGVKIIDEGQ